MVAIGVTPSRAVFPGFASNFFDSPETRFALSSASNECVEGRAATIETSHSTTTVMTRRENNDQEYLAKEREEYLVPTGGCADGQEAGAGPSNARFSLGSPAHEIWVDMDDFGGCRGNNRG